MRIIFLTSKFNFEGGGGSSPELDSKVRALRSLGHDVSVVTVFSQGNKPFSLPYTVHEERIPGDRGEFVIQSGIFHLLKKYEAQADVFCTEGQFAFGAGTYRLLGGRVPVEIHFNRELTSFPDTRSKAHFSFLRRMRFVFETKIGFRLIDRCSLFTFTSPVLRDLYGSLSLDLKKAIIIPDFFDTRAMVKLEGTTEETANKRGEPKEKLLLFCTGRLVKEKGFDIVIRAFARLQHRSQFHLCISGDGEEKDALLALAKELGVESSITFPGWVTKEELYAWYRKADIFLIPRWRPELTSMLVFEGMSFALPCIVVKDSAIAWQTADAALTFKDEDDADLAARIEEYASHPELRANLAKKGLARLEDLDERKNVVTLDSALRGIAIKK